MFWMAAARRPPKEPERAAEEKKTAYSCWKRLGEMTRVKREQG